MKKILLIITLLFSFLFSEAPTIPEKIFKNETGGKTENILYWGKNEKFASLGIGHFIWYGDHRGIYDETFPDFIEYLQLLDPDLNIPYELTLTECPWNSKKEFDAMKRTSLGNKIINFLSNETVVQHQMNFMVGKLKLVSENLIQDESLNFIEKFTAIKNAGGIFALIDYTNFKGFGTKPEERYNDQGWGLYQVFQEIEMDPNFEKNPLDVFKCKCRFVLKRRALNNPPDNKYLRGWFKRINTY